ncbi:MAG: PAS domain S-box protein [Rhodospirillales bacterium]|nr:PAS domain S-box protein [Rhodospirillales bacterium]
MVDKEKRKKPRNWPSFSDKSEQRASDALSRLEDITRLVSEIIWDMNEHEILTFVSPRTYEILGMIPQQMIGRKLTDLGTFFSAEQEKMEPNWGKPFRDHLFKINDADGSEKTFLFSGLPYFDKGTWQLKGVYGTAKDITERLEIDKYLRMQSEIIEQNPSMVIVTNIEGNIEYVNAMFTKMSGYSNQEAIGRNPCFLQSGEQPQEFYAELWDTIMSGEKWQGELKDKRKDGSYFWASVTISPIMQKDGSIKHFVSVHEDITERKVIENHLVVAKEQAVVANRAKSEILANMSHELRTPLNAIIGFASAIKAETFGPIGNKKYSEYINDIGTSGEHLLELINDILDVSAIEAGKLELNKNNLVIEGLVEESVRLIQYRAEKKYINLKVNIADSLPILYADKRRMKQILLNLLSNAVKFTPDNGTVALSVVHDETSGHVFTVTDTGIGMNHVELAKAMSEFGQVDSGLSRKEEGTGLGLPLTKGLVELHGGTFDVASEKGKGSTVTVCLPKERSNVDS